MKVAFTRLSLILCLLMFAVMPALAQDEGAGRSLTQDDWVGFMPIFIGAIIIVLLVDAFFIVPIFRKNEQNEGDK